MVALDGVSLAGLVVTLRRPDVVLATERFPVYCTVDGVVLPRHTPSREKETKHKRFRFEGERRGEIRGKMSLR